MRKTVGFTLAIVLLLATVLAGCSKEEKSTTVTSPTATSSPTASATPVAKEEPIAITIANQYPPDTDDNAAQKILEEKYNIKITNIKLDPAKWMEQLNLKLSSNEVPDIFLLFDSLDKYAKQGIIGEIPEELLRQKLPQWTVDMEKKNPFAFQDVKVDNKIYGMPRFNIEGHVAFPYGINGTYLKKVGATEAPKTLEELEAVLTKFRNDDPDGNGKKDTYGISTAVNGGKVSDSSFAEVFGAYQVFPMDWNENSNGSLELGMTTENARQAFKVLSKWYKAGIIDPEFITTDTAKYRANFVSGKYGMIEDIWYSFNKDAGVGLGFAKSNTELVFGKPVSGPGGAGVGYGWSVPVANNYYVISAQAAKDEKKLNKILDMFNGLIMDDDVYLTTLYGKKGVHWDMVDGVPTYQGEYTDFFKRAKDAGTGSLSLFRSNSFAMVKYNRPQWQWDFKEKITGGVPTLSNRATFIVPASLEFPNLRSIQDQFFIKFITGEVDLDAGFDKFVEQWNTAGGKKLTDELNAKYQERKASIK